jgi:hypothetical protein
MLMTRSPAPGAREGSRLRDMSPPGVGPMATGVLERMDEAEWISAGVLHKRYLQEVMPRAEGYARSGSGLTEAATSRALVARAADNAPPTSR